MSSVGVELSLNQERFFLGEKMTEANYSLPVTFDLKGDLDVDLLRRSLAEVLHRHPALRTVIRPDGEGRQRQVLTEGPEDPLESVDLSGRSAEQVAEAVRTRLHARIDLDRGHLVRAVLWRKGPDRYVFGFSHHHTVSDGVSLGIFIREVSTVYNALRRGEPIEPGTLVAAEAISFDATGSLSAEDRERLAKEWRDYLAGAASTASFPAVFDSSDAAGFKKRRVETVLSSEVVSRYRSFARENGTSTFSLVTAGFGLLLARQTGLDDLILAFQSSGRQNREDARDRIGLFSSVLVLRIRPRAHLRFDEYVRRVRQDILWCVRHQDYPYHLIMRETGTRPRVGINWYPKHPRLSLDGVEAAEVDYIEWDSDFDINLYCEYVDDGLRLKLLYDADRYDETSPRLLLHQLEHLLDAVVTSPPAALADYDVRTPEERAALPDPRLPLPAVERGPIFCAFLEAAARHPGRPAVVSERGSFTYGELEEASRRLAAHLASEGVGQGAVVGILADRDSSIAVAMLGVLRSGAAFFVTDAAYPEERIADFFRTASPRYVLRCGDAELPRSVAAAVEGIRGELAVPSNAREAADLPPVPENTHLPEVAADGVAYLSFTSGSRGRPKAIFTDHAPLAHFVRWQAKRFSVRPEDRFSMLSGLSHDPLLRDIFTPLSLGACLYVPTQDLVFRPEELFSWLRDEAITIVHLTPAIGEILATGAGEEGRLDAVRLFLWGGDRLRWSDLRTFQEWLAPRATHVNCYGTTETPQVVGYHVVPGLPDDRPIPIGRGSEGAELLVQRPDGGLAAAGEVGEILVRSRYLSLGYWQDPEGTAARFVPNPVTGDPEDCVYRTGDQGRYLPGGEVTYAGRLDDQVQIRGYRVELGEIQAKLEQCSGVDRALIRATDTEAGGTRLVAWYRPRNGAEIMPADLNASLRCKLPSHMLPTHYVRVEEFPIFPNGKVDPSRLPGATDEHLPASTAGDGEPRNAAEKRLAELWSEILGVPHVGIHDSFFDLGGDSLTAIRVVYKMERLGVDEKSCRGLFRGMTIAQLAASGDEGCGESVIERLNRERSSGGRRDAVSTNLLINCLRGILVILVVASHWMPGLLQRLPKGLHGLRSTLTPLFNIATPGFAVVFGISLGYIYLSLYEQDPARAKRLLRFGTVILFAAVVILAAIRVAGHLAEAGSITTTEVFDTLYSALLYYLLAVMTASLWFRVICTTRHQASVCVALALASFGVYLLLQPLLDSREFSGIAQLGKLVLAAKFNYFNMSVGAFVGIAAGLTIKRRHGEPGLARLFLLVGLLLMILGLVLSLTIGIRSEWWHATRDIRLWKWIFYAGAIFMLVALLRKVSLRHDTWSAPARQTVRLVAVAGQCSLPLFIAHHLVMGIKDLFELVGVSDLLSLALALGLFFATTAYLMKKIYGLHYGTL